MPVHVCTPENLHAAVEALQVATAPASLSSDLSDHTAAIMDTAAKAMPDARIRSLRDVTFRCKLNKDGTRFIGQVNVAFGLIRRMPPLDVARRVQQFVDTLLGNDSGVAGTAEAARSSRPRAARSSFDVGPCDAGHGGTAPHHGMSLDGGLWAVARWERGLDLCLGEQVAQKTTLAVPEQEEANESQQHDFLKATADCAAKVNLHLAELAAGCDCIESRLQKVPNAAQSEIGQVEAHSSQVGSGLASINGESLLRPQASEEGGTITRRRRM